MLQSSSGLFTEVEEDQGDADQAITRNQKIKHENNGKLWQQFDGHFIFRNMILRGLGVFATREQVYAEHRSDIRWVVMSPLSLCHVIFWFFVPGLCSTTSWVRTSPSTPGWWRPSSIWPGPPTPPGTRSRWPIREQHSDIWPITAHLAKYSPS